MDYALSAHVGPLPVLLSCLSRVGDVSLRVYRADDRQVRRRMP